MIIYLYICLLLLLSLLLSLSFCSSPWTAILHELLKLNVTFKQGGHWSWKVLETN